MGESSLFLGLELFPRTRPHPTWLAGAVLESRDMLGTRRSIREGGLLPGSQVRDGLTFFSGDSSVASTSSQMQRRRPGG